MFLEGREQPDWSSGFRSTGCGWLALLMTHTTLSVTPLSYLTPPRRRHRTTTAARFASVASLPVALAARSAFSPPSGGFTHRKVSLALRSRRAGRRRDRGSRAAASWAKLNRIRVRGTSTDNNLPKGVPPGDSCHRTTAPVGVVRTGPSFWGRRHTRLVPSVSYLQS